MKAYSPLQLVALGIAWLFSILFVFADTTMGQTNYTVGDTLPGNFTAYIVAPYLFQFSTGEAQFQAYVCSDAGDTSGQGYDCEIYESTTGPPEQAITIPQFDTLIQNTGNEFAAMLLGSHGWIDLIAIEVFDSTVAGSTAWEQAYDSYMPNYFTEIGMGRDRSGFYNLFILPSFISNHGQLANGLVWVDACRSYTLLDDFISADARVVIGPGDADLWSYESTERVATFFRRMDGHEGIGKRTVDSALQSPPHYMDSLMVSGNQNTTLSPVVTNVSDPSPLVPGDTIVLTLDTKCIRILFHRKLRVTRVN